MLLRRLSYFKRTDLYKPLMLPLLKIALDEVFYSRQTNLLVFLGCSNVVLRYSVGFFADGCI